MVRVDDHDQERGERETVAIGRLRGRGNRLVASCLLGEAKGKWDGCGSDEEKRKCATK